MSIYIFGYGSLISAASASRTLRREIGLSDLIPVYLLDYQRGWTVKDKVFSEKLAKEINAVFLNIEKAPGKMLNGVLIKITEKELDALSVREKNYDTFEIASFIRSKNEIPMDAETKIFTFVGKEDYKVSQAHTDVFIMKRYLDLVQAACSSLGHVFLGEYNETTEPAQFEVIEGNYTFVDIKQSKSV